MPQDHARALRERRPLTRRQKLIAAAGGSIVIVAVIVAVLLGSASSVRPGCFNVYIPGPIGAVQTTQCGATARATCQALTPSKHLTARDVQILAAGCRSAGLATRFGHGSADVGGLVP